MKHIILTLSLFLVTLASAKVEKGDSLIVSIKGVPAEEQAQINGKYRVGLDGNIHLPFLNRVPISAKGLSLSAVARRIENAYINAKVYTTPSISLESLRDQKKEIDGTETNTFITVSGSVAKPGPQRYHSKMTLIDVVSASSPTKFAAQNRVVLIRNGKTYRYDMKIPSHMTLKVYAKDQVILNEKKWTGR